MALGVERGERVAIWATNVPEWIVLQFAVAKIGAILVTANTSLRARDIDYLLRQSEAATLITIRGFRDVDYIAELTAIGALAGRDSGSSAASSTLATPTPEGSCRTSGSGAPQPRVSDADLDARSALDRRRRRDQHAVHVGHDRLSQRRDAVQPQHRQQRRRARHSARLHAGAIACACACRCSTASAASIGVLGAYTHGACLCPSRPSIRGRCSRRFIASAAPRSMACRRCSSRNWNARTSLGSI